MFDQLQFQMMRRFNANEAEQVARGESPLEDNAWNRFIFNFAHTANHSENQTSLWALQAQEQVFGAIARAFAPISNRLSTLFSSWSGAAPVVPAVVVVNQVNNNDIQRMPGPGGQ